MTAPAPHHCCYIGLGSNLETPVKQVQQALNELAQLPHSQLVNASSLYRSRAVGPGEQPDYINAVAQLTTQLKPLALLDALQAIEQAHQRQRLVRWGPRTLDLDLLLYDDLSIDNERLTVPHPYLTVRDFVLRPLLEIAPKLHLADGTSIASWTQRCDDTGLIKLPVQR
ncbi:2-amino-4-hydroxy-6-hydroxymethyldihydropteridine diphosphokinase [Gilvimarinus polysaccharolyticus]|uniref:2-amino-4-hydroxy-6- hydroxymethyldihydropteridine diphosphokinase n=1 Tax=Gilvimarinus polysaccharolyticus TaxID=863921 RepID=UPI00067376BF|nr:2-amino-4-hydroxy-6-hydroxymethyldihydropteridine diphosphokinase [Gilvimarinus polysaccharolyticus]